jgi:hypothetical protein
VVPGSLHIPRTVLEWRVAVDSPWRNFHLGGLDHQLILSATTVTRRFSLPATWFNLVLIGPVT